MKKLLLNLILLTPLLLAATQPKEWDVHGNLNAYIKNDNVVGGGGTAVEDRDGVTHNEELSLNILGPLSDGEAGVNMRGRTTNDERIQSEDATLLYFRGYYKDKKWNLEGGDVASSLNPYIFSGSLKGAKVVYKSDEKKRTFHYSAIAGFKKASWNELYTDENNELPTAYSGAVEVKYVHERAKEIAISLSSYSDDLSTGGVDSNVSGKEGYGVGLDGKWRFNKYINLKGRAAVTTGTDNKRDNVDDETQTALLLKLYTRPVLKSVKSNFIYQRVDAKYVSFGGTAPKDKEQIENMTSWRINKEYNARIDLKADRNNLDSNQTDGTTVSIYEAFTLNYRPSYLTRTDIIFKATNKNIDNDLKDDNRVTARLDITKRTRSGWRYGGGYEYSDYVDSIESNASRKTNSIHGLVGYKKKLSKTRSYRVTCRANYRNIDQEAGSQDTVGLNIDAGYIHNKKLSADLAYRLNNTDNEINNNIHNNTYQFRAAYKLDERGQNIVRLLAEKRDVKVDNTPDSSYDEYIQKLSLTMRF